MSTFWTGMGFFIFLSPFLGQQSTRISLLESPRSRAGVRHP